MRYAPDLSRLAIEDYKEHLKGIDLLPSRKILLNSIEENFSAISGSGISDVQTLMKEIATPAKMTAFSERTCIDLNYIKILKREVGSLMPKTVPLIEFDIVSPEAAQRLKLAGFRNSKDYFKVYPKIGDSICALIDCEKLYQLCGLVRVNGIGPLAAKLFLESGYTSVEDIASANADDMAKKINDINTEKHVYDGRLGIKDMTFCIVHAGMLKRYS